MSDEVLERFISTLNTIGVEYGRIDVEISRKAFDLMGELVKQRSPRQVARMEARLPGQWRS